MAKKKPLVYVTRKIPAGALARLHRYCDVLLWGEELPPPREQLLRDIAGADGVLCLLTDTIDEAIFRAAPKLRVVSNMAVGYDNIDIAAATRRGIPVGNTPDVLTETSADFAFALLMAAARRIPEGERYVKGGHWRTWSPMLLMGCDIYGATLGIVGLGRIGQAVARRARGFDMRILYHGGSDAEAAAALGAQQVDFVTLLQESDFVSLHVPLTTETRGMIDAQALRLMKSTAVLINTARGPVVETMALYEALKSGEIAAAALDVTDPEPLPADHSLLQLENCLVTPHIASSSQATRAHMAHMAVNNVIAGLRGEPLPYCVNPEVYSDKP